MDRLRAFDGHQVDMGLSALSLGEFGDVVSNTAAMHRIQSSVHVIRTKLQQDPRRRRCGTRHWCVVGSKEPLHQTLAPASVSVLRWRGPIDLVALAERRGERSDVSAAASGPSSTAIVWNPSGPPALQTAAQNSGVCARPWYSPSSTKRDCAIA